MYDCVICHSSVSSLRLHCPNCGTIPAEYSPAEIPVVEKADYYLGIVRAYGSKRANQGRAKRLRSINLTEARLIYSLED